MALHIKDTMGLANFVTRVSKGAAAVGSGATRVPVEVIRSLGVLLFVLLIGMALILSRELIILVSPFIAEHAVAITTTINVIFSALFIVVTILVDIVIFVIHVIDFIRRVVPGCHNVGRGPAYKKLGVFTPFSAEDLRRFFSDLPNRCYKYNKVPYLLSVSTKRETNRLLCPIVRASYPVDWMWDTTNTLFGWAIVDATPYGVHTQTGEPAGNCHEDLHRPDWECVGLGIGYIVVDVLFPFMVLMIAWPYIITPLLKLGFTVVTETLSLLGGLLRPEVSDDRKRK